MDDQPGGLPGAFAIISAYPNPFNSRTNITYSLYESGNVKLEIYDLMGRQQDIIVNQFQYAGEYHASWDAADMPSGVYFARLECGQSTATTRLVLVK